MQSNEKSELQKQLEAAKEREMKLEKRRNFKTAGRIIY